MKRKQKYIETISQAKVAARAAKESLVVTNFSPEAKKVIESLASCLESMTNVFALFGSPHTPSSKVGSVLGELKNKTPKTNKKKGGGKLVRQNPDQIIRHELLSCKNCNTDLSHVAPIESKTRQEVSIKVKKTFIDHVTEVKDCPCCKKQSESFFPPYITRPTQYGPSVKSATIELSVGQFLPFRRLKDHLSHNFDIWLSEQSIENFREELSVLLVENETTRIEKLMASKAIHMDETGIKIGKEQYWLHSISNENETYFHVSKYRGQKAHEEMSFIFDYKGVIIHDCWPSYFLLKSSHALCHAHILRELVACMSAEKHKWCGEMKKFLLKCHKIKNKTPSVDVKKYIRLEKEYDSIIARALNGYRRPTLKKGRPNRSDSHNLLLRLKEYKESALRFLKDPDVAFTNNLAERDIRMGKLHQKISGLFRSEHGAKAFFRIRGFISTEKKQNRNYAKSIELVFSHKFTG
ncbi:MAG: IS66 family transposase [Bacteriovoracaceae bacterium]|nr:IS66 family transposase [Bacteriovoracaceae bacterium]